jgi:hypothetical protein
MHTELAQRNFGAISQHLFQNLRNSANFRIRPIFSIVLVRTYRYTISDMRSFCNFWLIVVYSWVRYTNNNTASLYTFEADICFLLALAGKLAFPWLYTFFTGHSRKKKRKSHPSYFSVELNSTHRRLQWFFPFFRFWLYFI